MASQYKPTQEQISNTVYSHNHGGTDEQSQAIVWMRFYRIPFTTVWVGGAYRNGGRPIMRQGK